MLPSLPLPPHSLPICDATHTPFPCATCRLTSSHLLTSLPAPLPRVPQVAVLIVFVSAAFAILGMQLFSGQLHHRCYAEEDLRATGLDPSTLLPGSAAPPGVLPLDAQRGVCNPEISHALSEISLGQIASHTIASPTTDGGASSPGVDRHIDGGCVAGVCLDYGVSPMYSTISFDSFPNAMMTVFMCITGEGWTEVMYMTMHGYHPAACIYFVLLTLFGTFYIVNLFLAVLWETYSSLPKDLTPEEQASVALLRLLSLPPPAPSFLLSSPLL